MSSLFLTRVEVSLEDVIERIFAYREKTVTWNGCQCPYFTKEESDRIMEILNERYKDHVVIAYDSERDAYTETFIEDDYAPTEYTGSDYETEDGTLHLYCMGGWEWLWTVYGEEE